VNDESTAIAKRMAADRMFHRLPLPPKKRRPELPRFREMTASRLPRTRSGAVNTRPWS
jgi:hypothetical protein